MFTFILTDNALKRHETLCDNNDYFNVEMLNQFNRNLKCNHREKSLKTPPVICADL